jgi:hypothetical protein
MRQVATEYSALDAHAPKMSRAAMIQMLPGVGVVGLSEVPRTVSADE